MTIPASSSCRADLRPSLPLWRWIVRFVVAYLAAVMLTALTMPIAASLVDGDFKIFREFGDFFVSRWFFVFCTFIGIFALLPAVVVFVVVLLFRLPSFHYIVPTAGLVGFAGAAMVASNTFSRLPHDVLDYVYIAAMTVCGLAAGLVFWFIAFRPPRAPDETAGS